MKTQIPSFPYLKSVIPLFSNLKFKHLQIKFQPNQKTGFKFKPKTTQLAGPCYWVSMRFSHVCATWHVWIFSPLQTHASHVPSRCRHMPTLLANSHLFDPSPYIWAVHPLSLALNTTQPPRPLVTQAVILLSTFSPPIHPLWSQPFIPHLSLFPKHLALAPNPHSSKIPLKP